MNEQGASRRTPSRLARAVRMERDRKGWTSERLADAAGVSHSWVRNFEAGIIQNPGADRLRALEEALDLRIGELYAAGLNVPYDKLVADITAGAGERKVPWEQVLDGQRAILKELKSLARRLSPSSSLVDEDAVAELVGGAVAEGIQEGQRRAAHHQEADGASS